MGAKVLQQRMQRDSPVWPNGDDVKGEGAAAGAAEKSEAALEAAPNPEKAAGAAGCKAHGKSGCLSV